MNTLPPPTQTALAAAQPAAPLPFSWRDCLHMSPEVAAIIMGVTVAQAESHLRAAATRRSRQTRADDVETVAGDFKHSALAFTTPGHSPLTRTYRLILNKPIADTYACRGCKTSQPLPDSGMEPLCEACSAAKKDRLTQEKKEQAERKAKLANGGSQKSALAMIGEELAVYERTRTC